MDAVIHFLTDNVLVPSLHSHLGALPTQSEFGSEEKQKFYFNLLIHIE